MPKTLPRRAIAILASVVIAAVALFALYTWIVLNWSYSEGERAGYLQKLSRKGWLCKTWEGEILLSSMPGAIPERFNFTVRAFLGAWIANFVAFGGLIATAKNTGHETSLIGALLSKQP